MISIPTASVVRARLCDCDNCGKTIKPTGEGGHNRFICAACVEEMLWTGDGKINFRPENEGEFSRFSYLLKEAQ